MGLLRTCRWLVPAALSFFVGLWLALWHHDNGSPATQASSATSAAPPAPRTGRRPATLAPATLTPAEAAPDSRPPPARTDSVADPAPAEALSSLAAGLTKQARDDADGALAALLALDVRKRRYLSEDVVRQAALHAPERTLQWLNRHVADETERQRLLVAAYAGIAGHDPAFAMNALEALPDDEARRLARHQVLEAWAEKDVVAAYEWAGARQGEDADEVLVSVMHAYVRQLPQQAGQLIAAMPDGQIRNRLAERYVDHVAASDPESALAWASGLDHEAPLSALLASAFDQWAQREPWAALEHATARVDGEASFELVGRIATHMGADDPAELAAGLDRVPQAYRAPAAEALAVSWASHDPEAARGWADALPEGPVRDAAIGAMSGSSRYQTTSLSPAPRPAS